MHSQRIPSETVGPQDSRLWRIGPRQEVTSPMGDCRQKWHRRLQISQSASPSAVLNTRQKVFPVSTDDSKSLEAKGEKRCLPQEMPVFAG
jgi:hypothetical protein